MTTSSLELHTWTTPNGRKPLVLLYELGVEHTVHPVDLGKNEQKTPEYLAINPNGKIPALIDRRGGGEVRVFESGAILIHLAETVGAETVGAEAAGRFLPTGGQERADVLGWLMFQMGGVGPMFGQAYHFKTLEPKVPYGEERYGNEVKRLVGVLESRLSRADWLGAEYSIADMATYPWMDALPKLGVILDEHPGVVAWMARMAARPAVARAMAWAPEGKAPAQDAKAPAQDAKAPAQDAKAPAQDAKAPDAGAPDATKDAADDAPDPEAPKTSDR